MRKLSEINEGMFSGMVRRGNTDQVKKEDEIPENMPAEEMLEYLQTLYDFSYIKISDDYLSKYKYIFVRLFSDIRHYMYINYSKKTGEFKGIKIDDVKYYYGDLSKEIKEKYNTRYRDGMLNILPAYNDLNTKNIVGIFELITEFYKDKEYLLGFKKK